MNSTDTASLLVVLLLEDTVSIT